MHLPSTTSGFCLVTRIRSSPNQFKMVRKKPKPTRNSLRHISHVDGRVVRCGLVVDVVVAQFLNKIRFIKQNRLISKSTTCWQNASPACDEQKPGEQSTSPGIVPDWSAVPPAAFSSPSWCGSCGCPATDRSSARWRARPPETRTFLTFQQLQNAPVTNLLIHCAL